MFSRKRNHKLAVILLVSMLMQISGPLALNVFADITDGVFRVTNERIEEGIAYIDWKFELKSDNQRDEAYSYDCDFTLPEEITEALVDNDGVAIGSYNVTTGGKLTINIDKELYELYFSMNKGEFDIEDSEEGSGVDDTSALPADDDDGDDNKDKGADDEDAGSQGEQAFLRGRILGVVASAAESLSGLWIDSDEEESLFFRGTIVIDGVITEAENKDDEAEPDEKDLGENEAKEEGAIIPQVMSMFGVDGGLQLFGGDEGNNLGNIFTFNYLRLGGATGTDIVDGGVIEYTEDTIVQLDYLWDTGALTVNPGDWSEINVPDAFKLPDGISWTDKDIVLSDNSVVGTYSLVNNVLRFDFDDRITSAGSGATNGYVGFGLVFNLEKFTTDIVEEIEFNDKTEKKITVITKPESTISQIDKDGEADADKDAKEIKWTIDVANPSTTPLTDSKVTDTIPTGLEYKNGSIVVSELTIGKDGEFNKGSEYSSYTFDPSAFEVTLGEIAPYKGYRIEYITTIKDYEETSFSNNAKLTYTGSGDDITAVGTVSGIERSDFIEKDGDWKESYGNKIKWSIDINKAGGSIDNAIIEESFPEGLSLVTDSIKVYKLTKNGSNWTETLDETKNFDNFPIGLGKLESSDAYRIKYETSINFANVNSSDYQKTNSFENIVTLKDGETEIDTAKKAVTVERKPILRKEGEKSIDYDNEINRTLTWTIHVNEGNHSIGGATITDVIPEGLSINTTDVAVYDKDGDQVPTGISITATAITEGVDKDKTKLEISLGNITEYHKIVYKTTITDFSKGSFANNASLAGTGVGDGETIDPVTGTPPSNSYTKTFDGIDYNNKIMKWTITVNPQREPISELKIEDTFPNNGLVLLEESPGEALVVKSGSATLTRGTDYNLVPKDGSYNKGFIIEFQKVDGTTTGLNLKEIITVEYTTSYDPEKGILPNTDNSTNKKYKNMATFTGKTNSGITINTSANAEKQVLDSSWNSGKKLGKLISVKEDDTIESGWISGNTRKIEWEVYINYLKQDWGENVTVTDAVYYDGEIEENSFIVMEYVVAENGDTSYNINSVSPEKLSKDTDYTVDLSTDKKSFTLDFDETKVDKRYVIIFTTTVPDISEATYTNTAAAKVNGSIYPYEGSVGFTNHNNNLSKNALEGVTTTGKAYTDEEIKWQIKINESLSVIQKDVVVEDTISSGLVYKEDSLKVYKLIGSLRTKVDEGTTANGGHYDLEVSDAGDGKTKLKISFNDTIDSTYEIEYITVVTATTGTINNTVEYSGLNLNIESVESDKIQAQQFSYVGGDPNKGMIRVSSRG